MLSCRMLDTEPNFAAPRFILACRAAPLAGDERGSMKPVCAHRRVPATNNGRPAIWQLSRLLWSAKPRKSKLQAFEKSASVSAHRDTLREELLRRYADRAPTHGHETSHQAAMAASPKACGVSATPIGASLVWAVGPRRLSARSFLYAIFAQPSPECLAGYTGNARPTTRTLWPMASSMYAVAAAVLSKPLGGHSPTSITPTHGYEATRVRPP